MQSTISINLYKGKESSSDRMVHEFMREISDYKKAGQLRADFAAGVLTLSSDDIDLLGEVEEKAQTELGYVID